MKHVFILALSLLGVLSLDASSSPESSVQLANASYARIPNENQSNAHAQPNVRPLSSLRFRPARRAERLGNQARGRVCCKPLFTVSFWDPIKIGLLCGLTVSLFLNTLSSDRIDAKLDNLVRIQRDNKEITHEDLQAILRQMQTPHPSALSYALPEAPAQASMPEPVTPQYVKIKQNFNPIVTLRHRINKSKPDEKRN